MSNNPEGYADHPDAKNGKDHASSDQIDQVPNMSTFQSSNAAFQMFPMMHPSLIRGMVPAQNPEENDHGPGLHAVPYHPFMGPMAGFPANTLIPLKYKIPTRETSAGGPAEGQGQGQEARQQHGPRRQMVVRRFHFAIQLDLALIIKLAAVVFLLSQEGSNQKLILLVFFASLVYLYQTGALTPFIRWLRRGAAPPPPRPVQPEHGAPIGRDDGNNLQPGENNEAENQNHNQDQDQAMDNQEQLAANENRPEPEARNGFNWWGIVKEIQMFVVGFVTSLLPGLHND